MTTSPATSYKNLLQEHCQKMKIALPHYSVVSQTANKASFRATVTVMGRNFASEDGFNTKKRAEQNAAKVTLQNLNLPPFSEGKTNSQSNIPAKECSPASDIEVRRSAPAAVEGNISLTERPTSCAVSAVVSTTLPPTSPISYKNLLQERAQKLGVGLPIYDTQACDGSFVCVVTFEGQSFKSCSPHKAKKQAEQDTASVVLASLFSSPTASSQSVPSSATLLHSTPASANTDMSPPMFNLTPHSITPEVHKIVGEVSWKNLLQEHVQQRGMKLPVYNTTWNGTGFVCCLQIGNGTLPPPSVYPNKKQAEQMAAKEGLLFLGLNPEEMAKFKGRTKRKRGQNKHSPHLPRPGQMTSWVHPNWNRDPHIDSSWEEMDYFWEQSITKRQRVDTSQQEWDLPAFDSRPYMSVGEVWKEKKNIVVVGNAQASFVLYCTAVPDRCQLFCEAVQSLVTLQPGHRIIGLDAHYLEQGKVALQATRCMDILFPASPDPVLTSCGVVLLYQDPEHRSGIQVLLKRYLVSQAFINVLAALAQYFRRKIAGRPIRLDMKSSVEHIHEWMLQEVHHIAAMDEASLRQMFSHIWKFNEKWCLVLKPSLPGDLQELQALATEELARRQVTGINYSEDFYRPWSLPKGNFKHRVLSTGLLIESPAECAVRELREETGIQLDSSEVQCLPCVDLPHQDNLNPHCGDIVRYYLYVYTTDEAMSDEELNTTEEANTSVAWEAEASQGEGMPTTVGQPSPLPTTQGSDALLQNFDCTLAMKNACELQLQEHGNEHSCQTASERLVHEGQGGTEKGEDALKEVQNTVLVSDDKEVKICETEEQRECGEQESGIEISQVAKTSLADGEESKGESSEVQGAVHAESNTGIGQERKGLKRKRDSDDESDCTSGYPSAMAQEGLCQTPSGKQPSECIDNTATPMKSPHVQGGIHEECTWLPLNEATLKSPLFGQIYNTTPFMELLASMEVHSSS